MQAPKCAFVVGCRHLPISPQFGLVGGTGEAECRSAVLLLCAVRRCLSFGTCLELSKLWWPQRSSELNSMLQSEHIDLFSGELFWRHPRRSAGLPEKAVQTRRRCDPEKKQFMIGIFKSVP